MTDAIDYSQDVMDNLRVNVVDLFRACADPSRMVVRGKTFRNCLIEGPAVILPQEHCAFDGCDFGFGAGDVDNLLLQPVGVKVTGAIPFAETRFENCTFHAIGFTGPPQMIQEFQSLKPGPKP